MKKHTTDLKLIKRILSYLKLYKSRFIIIILCLIATTMVGFLQPLIIRVITDDGLMNRNIHTVITAVIFLLLSVLAEQGIEMW